MEKIYDSLLKKRVVSEIERIGDGICEIIISVDLSFGQIDTVEYDESINKIYVHSFEYEDYDIVYDFDELVVVDKIEIIKTLKAI